MFGKIAENPEFWSKVRSDKRYGFMIDRLFDMYKEVGASENISALKYSEYKLFFETGDRYNYEKNYFYKRRRLNCTAILSLLYPENEEYIKKLQDTIWSICDDYSWVLPAHISDYPQIDNHTVDLFSAETGFALSEIKFLLKNRLDELICNRIDCEINKRITVPFLNHTQTWEGADNNWAAVCAGSVAAAFMYQRPDLFEKIKPRITTSVNSFLGGYHNDGVCLEGLAYWEYGFGFFVWYADLLKDFSDGKEDLFKSEKVREIAAFPQKVFLTNNVVVSFSDGSVKAKLTIGLIHYLKTIYGEYVGTISADNFKSDDFYCGRWCHHIRSFVFFNPDYLETQTEKNAVYYLENSQWYIMKNSNYSFAAKGGHNYEPHNHNDVGSFIVAKGDKQLLADIGCGEYSEQYFNPKTRYTVLCNSSLGHSVPVINGREQSEGAEFCGTLSVDNNCVTVDMTKAYDVPSLKILKREIILEENSLKLTDSYEFDGEGEYVCRIVSFIKPELSENEITVDAAVIRYKNLNCGVSVSEHSHSVHNENRDIPVYIIDFKPQNTNNFSIDILIK